MNQHPLINGAKALFESGRLSYGGEYLKPAKKLLVDLAVTKTGLDKALSFANAFFVSLEEHGHRVVIAPHGEYQFRKEEDRYSVRVSMERIEKEGYNLNISRYISTAVADEEIGLERVNVELETLEQKIVAAKEKHNAFLKELGLPPLKAF